MANLRMQHTNQVIAARSSGSYSGRCNQVEVRYARDEEEAAMELLTRRGQRNHVKEVSRKERAEARAKAKITMPKFSWDK